MVGWMAALLVDQKDDQMVVEKAGLRVGWLVDQMVAH